MLEIPTTVCVGHICFLGAIYLFTYGLFNDAVTSSDLRHRTVRLFVLNELERMWKEAVVA
jgi:hypothetical protein